MWLEIATAAAFLLIALLVILLVRLLGQRGTNKVERRLNDLPPDLAHVVADEPLFGELTESLAAQVPQFQQDITDLQCELYRAGDYRPKAAQEFRALRNVFVLFALVIAGLLVAMIGPEHTSASKWVAFGGPAVDRLPIQTAAAKP